MTDRRELLDALRAAGIRDERVLEAFAEVPRQEFVAPASRRRAYEDVPLPIPHGLVTTQPSLIARMVEALELGGDERVLEVGTGYGFQTALLAYLADDVWSVERHPDLAEVARSSLDRLGVGNARVVVADGTEGLPAQSPFDAIVVAAAFPRVPPPLAGQLAAGGRLVQPIGPGGREEVALFLQRHGGLRRAAMLTGANFVRLVGAHGFREA